MDVDPWLITWIVLAALFAVTELATVAFVALYLSLGAAVAAIIAALDGGLPWQLLGFILTGGVLLVLTRPVLKKRLELPDVLTNVHRVIGRTGMVTIPVDNNSNTGQIRIGTEYWTARTPEDVHGATIPVDARVRVLTIEGVTARVEAID